MKIVLVIDRFDPAKGGAERWISLVLAELHARGHSLHLCATSWAEPLPAPMTCHRVRVPRFPRWCRDQAFAARSAGPVQAIRPDLTIALRHVPWVDVYLALGGLYCETLRANLRAGPSLGRRLAYRMSPKYRVLLALERRLMTRQPAPLVLTPSPMVRQHCLDDFHYDPARVVVVPHGIDLVKYQPADPGTRQQLRAGMQWGNETVALFVAHNFRLKGLPWLLKAWATLPADRFRLVVAGRDRPPAAAARLPNVQFLGARADLRALYQAADYLVLPTFYDVFPMVMIEALASGLPVITTRFNGAADLMTDGQEGFVLDDPRDTTALTDRFQRLADPATRQRCAAAARRLAERYPEAILLGQTVYAIEAEARRLRETATP